MHYPLCHVWSEVELVRQRVHQRMATEAVLIQQAIVSVLAGGKEFSNLLKDLTDG